MSTLQSWSSDSSGRSALLQGHSQRSTGDRRAPRVLVAAPTSAPQDELFDRIELAGFDVTAVDSADDLLLQCDMEAPSAVVLFSNLPDAYIPDLIEQLQGLSGARRFPIVVVRDAANADGHTGGPEPRLAGQSVHRTSAHPRAITALLERLLLDREPVEPRFQAQFPTRVVWPTARTRPTA